MSGTVALTLSDYAWPIALTTAAGLASGLGGLACFVGKNGPSQNVLGQLLAVGTGVMLWMSLHLLNDAAEHLSILTIAACFVGGAACFYVLSWWLPEEPNFLLPAPKHEEVEKVVGGGEHEERKGKAAAKRHLVRVGLMMMLAISLHNFPEGLAVFFDTLGHRDSSSIRLALAMAVHNIPEGMAVAVPIYQATGKRWTAFFCATLSGLCEPIGAILFGILFTKCGVAFETELMSGMLAAISGIMVLICAREIPYAIRNYCESRAMRTQAAISLGLSVLSMGLLSSRLFDPEQWFGTPTWFYG